MMAVLHCELDRDEEARRAFERLAGSRFDLPGDLAWLRSMTDCAAVCAHLRDRTSAALLRDLLTPHGDQLGFPLGGIANGSVAHYLGLLATTLERFEAEARFAAAEAMHSRIGAPTWWARTRLEWAWMLLRRQGPGDVKRARGLLDQALATAVGLGLGSVARRARQVLEGAR